MKVKINKFMSCIPYVISNDELVEEACTVMSRHDIHHLPVVDKKSQLVGIVSDRDIKFVQRFDSVEKLSVGEIMTELPFCVGPDADVEKTVTEMADKGYGSAIVMEDKEVVGIFTTTDVLRAFSYYINWEKENDRD